MLKKLEKSKVKIVPRHRWPPFFRAIGVYDIPYDKIYIKGELPKPTHRQTLKHEKAHRKWFLKHRLIRKISILLWAKPALYYILAVPVTIFFLFSVLFWFRSLVIYSVAFSIILFISHLGVWYIFFEIPAWKAAGFFVRGMGIKEIAKSGGIDLLTMLTPFFLWEIGLWFFDSIAALIFLGYGLFISWIFIIYTFAGTLVVLRKVAPNG